MLLHYIMAASKRHRSTPTLWHSWGTAVTKAERFQLFADRQDTVQSLHERRYLFYRLMNAVQCRWDLAHFLYLFCADSKLLLLLRHCVIDRLGRKVHLTDTHSWYGCSTAMIHSGLSQTGINVDSCTGTGICPHPSPLTLGVTNL